MSWVEGTTAYRVAKRLTARPMRAAYDLVVEHAENIPSFGPAIVVANHRSFMDSIFLAGVVERPVTFLAKAEYFDDRRVAWIFRRTGQIPVRRGSPAGARAAMDAATAVLRKGSIIALYPEGTRSRDGQLRAGNLGAARLAIATGAPIIPVGLIGTDQVQAPGERLPHIGRRVEVRFGAPIVADQRADTRAHSVELTHEMMSAIGSLCGQPYARRRRSELVGA